MNLQNTLISFPPLFDVYHDSACVYMASYVLSSFFLFVFFLFCSFFFLVTKRQEKHKFSLAVLNKHTVT